MAQQFNDIKVSDKGMVKLIRNHGKDYIFPANQIIQIGRVKEEHSTNLYDILGTIISGDFSPKYSVVIIVKGGERLYVNVPYTDELYEALDNAHTISERMEERKYGKFNSI